MTILPGSIIEDNVIAGAKPLVKGELQSNYVYAGIPAIKYAVLNTISTIIEVNIHIQKSLTIIKRNILANKL